MALGRGLEGTCASDGMRGLYASMHSSLSDAYRLQIMAGILSLRDFPSLVALLVLVDAAVWLFGADNCDPYTGKVCSL